MKRKHSTGKPTTTENGAKAKPINGSTNTTKSTAKITVVKCEKCGSYRYNFGGAHAVLNDRGLLYDCVGDLL